MTAARRLLAAPVLLVPLAVAITLPAGTDAAYPGGNGRIAHTTGDGTGQEIVTVLPNGTDPDTLTTNSLEEAEPRWSSDAGTIIFERIDGDNDVWTMSAGGANEVPHVQDASSDSDPDIHPSSFGPGRIVFESDRTGEDEIYTMNLDGTNLKRLTSKGATNAEPAWSPSGGKIAFHSERNGDDEIMVMRANGKDKKLLTSNGVDDQEPEWSPTGNRIVFDSLRNGGDDEVVRMKADGSKERALTDNDDNDDEPDFSPDGTRIVFESDRDGDDEIWTMDLAGSAASLFQVTTNTVSDDSPDWGIDPS